MVERQNLAGLARINKITIPGSRRHQVTRRYQTATPALCTVRFRQPSMDEGTELVEAYGELHAGIAVLIARLPLQVHRHRYASVHWSCC